MGIEISEQNNGEQLIEYKIPTFNNNNINDNYYLGNRSEDYEILQVLGGGGFSKVLKVKSKTNFGIYAMKKVDMVNIVKEQDLSQKYFENEVLFLKKLNHPNIIKCYNIFQEGQYLYFIMEFMNNGDLESYNKGNISMRVKIPEPKLWDIFYKCLSGLDYIHKKKIVHRDIKLQNLFLDDQFNVKIGDFNISAVIDKYAAMEFADNQQQINNLMNENTTLGTRDYQAPEIGRREYDQKVDVYSMGVSFYELCYGHIPEKGYHSAQEYEKLYSKEIRNFIGLMIQKNENERPNCNEAMLYAKDNFIKLYVKNTSVESVLNCFSNFPNVIQYFSNNVIINQIYELKKTISNVCFSVIQTTISNDIIQKKRNLYELRKTLEKEGLNIKSDNKEIEPGNFIIFFIRKLNSELNEIIRTNNNISEKEEIKRYKILSRKYSFPPNDQENSFQIILDTYNKKILSLISRNFFSFIKIKRTCIKCRNSRCSFSKLFFVPINVGILMQKLGFDGKYTLKNGIDSLKVTVNNIEISKGVKCETCNQVSQFEETINFYHTAKNLIFIFDRGQNFENKDFIDFDEYLYLNKGEVERYNQVSYYLIGIIQKVQEEYISFIKNNNIWISSKGEQFNFVNVKKYGMVVALFYYSNDNFLILESQQINPQIRIQQNMYQNQYQQNMNPNQQNMNQYQNQQSMNQYQNQQNMNQYQNQQSMNQYQNQQNMNQNQYQQNMNQNQYQQNMNQNHNQQNMNQNQYQQNMNQYQNQQNMNQFQNQQNMNQYQNQQNMNQYQNQQNMNPGNIQNNQFNNESNFNRQNQLMGNNNQNQQQINNYNNNNESNNYTKIQVTNLLYKNNNNRMINPQMMNNNMQENYGQMNNPNQNPNNVMGPMFNNNINNINNNINNNVFQNNNFQQMNQANQETQYYSFPSQQNFNGPGIGMNNNPNMINNNFNNNGGNNQNFNAMNANFLNSIVNNQNNQFGNSAGNNQFGNFGGRNNNYRNFGNNNNQLVNNGNNNNQFGNFENNNNQFSNFENNNYQFNNGNIIRFSDYL